MWMKRGQLLSSSGYKQLVAMVTVSETSHQLEEWMPQSRIFQL